MAKLTPEQWQLAKIDYEVHGLSYSDLMKKYGMSKGIISKRAKDENWQQGKIEQLVQDKFNAIKDLQKTEQQIEQLEPIVQKSIEQEVIIRLEREKLFTDSALRNQELANRVIQETDKAGELGIMDLKVHSQITAQNKETVLGKQPDTAIQVNNNIEQKPTIIELVAPSITYESTD